MASLSVVFASIKSWETEYNEPTWPGVHYSEPLEYWFLVRQRKTIESVMGPYIVAIG